MRYFHFLLIFFLFSIHNAHGQKVKFGKVTTAELMESQDSVFGEIPAKVIYKKITLNYGKDLEIHERIKIYNKEGFEHSNWEIVFPDISHLQAFTYNLENGIVNKVHVTKESIFKETLYGDYEVTKITFPNVKEGSVIELKYKVDYGRWGVIAIQKDLPIKKFRLVVERTPSIIEFKQNPNFPLQLIREETGKKSLVIYNGKDIPALDNAPFVNNIDNYRGKLYLKYKKEKEDEQWGQLTGQFNRAYWFGQQLETKPFFKKDLAKLIAAKKDSMSLAKSIYGFLQNRMVYNGKYSIATYDLKDNYKTKNGDKADINMILTLMLREAGFEANPMVIGCKHKGEVLFAEVSSFNALICALQLGDEFHLLDASEQNAKFGQIPVDLMNGYGLIVRDDGTSISFPTETKIHSMSIAIVNVELDPETFVVSGSLKNQLTDYLAWEYRDASKDEDKENLAEALEAGYNLLSIDNFAEKDIDNENKPVVLSYDFTYEDAVEDINGELYIAPFLFFGETENEFDEEDRKYPIDVEYPYTQSYNISFSVPEGYEVSSLPEGKKVTIEDGVGSLMYNSSVVGRKIQIGLTVKINYAMIPADYYGGLKALYSEYVEISKSKIVLSKI